MLVEVVAAHMEQGQRLQGRVGLGAEEPEARLRLQLQQEPQARPTRAVAAVAVGGVTQRRLLVAQAVPALLF
jgi:predicted 2-oxoglutarate/Fe(II)-dependent dioxygenase YbiX